jgi:hypothetical protein
METSNQVQNISPSKIFNSNSVSNLNLIPKGKLFLIFQSINKKNVVLLQQNKGVFPIYNSVHFLEYKNHLILGWVQNSAPVNQTSLCHI